MFFLAPVIKQLTAEFDMIKGIAVNVNRSKSSEIYGEKTEVIWGNADISEEVLDYQFLTFATSFLPVESTANRSVVWPSCCSA